MYLESSLVNDDPATGFLSFVIVGRLFFNIHDDEVYKSRHIIFNILPTEAQL